jgi:hypothetical protein
MTATAVRPTPESAQRRAGYRNEYREALRLGVAPADIAVVVEAFRGENPDIDEVHRALMSYVPLATFHDDVVQLGGVA